MSISLCEMGSFMSMQWLLAIYDRYRLQATWKQLVPGPSCNFASQSMAIYQLVIKGHLEIKKKNILRRHRTRLLRHGFASIAGTKKTFPNSAFLSYTFLSWIRVIESCRGNNFRKFLLKKKCPAALKIWPNTFFFVMAAGDRNFLLPNFDEGTIITWHDATYD